MRDAGPECQSTNYLATGTAVTKLSDVRPGRYVKVTYVYYFLCTVLSFVMFLLGPGSGPWVAPRRGINTTYENLSLSRWSVRQAAGCTCSQQSPKLGRSCLEPHHEPCLSRITQAGLRVCFYVAGSQTETQKPFQSRRDIEESTAVSLTVESRLNILSRLPVSEPSRYPSLPFHHRGVFPEASQPTAEPKVPRLRLTSIADTIQSDIRCGASVLRTVIRKSVRPPSELEISDHSLAVSSVYPSTPHTDRTVTASS
ncbi:hypothetical protein BJ170DRAFT_259435 [Xylariales sp. AK1849]|nr:hypothetical protein BJ170DRAFT_259435 [Xylariales sp. AK1849]